MLPGLWLVGNGRIRTTPVTGAICDDRPTFCAGNPSSSSFVLKPLRSLVWLLFLLPFLAQAQSQSSQGFGDLVMRTILRPLNQRIMAPGERAKREAWEKAASPGRARLDRASSRVDLSRATLARVLAQAGDAADTSAVVRSAREDLSASTDDLASSRAEMNVAGGLAYVEVSRKYHSREAFVRWVVFMTFATTVMTLLRLGLMKAFGFKREGSLLRRGVYTRRGKVVWPRPARGSSEN